MEILVCCIKGLRSPETENSSLFLNWLRLVNVCSLTQFFSCSFSQSTIIVQECVFYKPSTRVCISRFTQSSALIPATWTCRCISGIPKATYEVILRALESRSVISKMPFKGGRPTHGSCLKERNSTVSSPTRGQRDKPMNFHKVQTF